MRTSCTRSAGRAEQAVTPVALAERRRPPACAPWLAPRRSTPARSASERALFCAGNSRPAGPDACFWRGGDGARLPPSPIATPPPSPADGCCATRRGARRGGSQRSARWALRERVSRAALFPRARDARACAYASAQS
eukprot:1404713-Pleurochrysis_carterae.AAC.2